MAINDHGKKFHNICPWWQTKIPQRGPFQIIEIKQRNVVLLDPETGQTVNTHLELIRPLNLNSGTVSASPVSS